MIVRLLAAQFKLERVAFLYERFLLFAGYLVLASLTMTNVENPNERTPRKPVRKSPGR